MDRNDFPVVPAELTTLSLSARRAWIEIGLSFARKIRIVSLSARRAWIEITRRTYQQGEKLTSLSARRAWIEIGCWLPDHSWWLRRSPQGERG